MENDRTDHPRFGWKNVFMVAATASSVIALLINPEVRKFATSLQAWVYIVWVVAAIIWSTDRYRIIRRWAKGVEDRVNKGLDTLDAKVKAFDAVLDNQRKEWLRNFTGTVDNKIVSTVSEKFRSHSLR